MNDAIAICAPTANSYRRFQPEAYVPLNPSWSVNNRGVAFRVPHGPPASRRVEHRGRVEAVREEETRGIRWLKRIVARVKIRAAVSPSPLPPSPWHRWREP